MKEFLMRFKSWALWLALASLITFCIKEFTGIDINEDLNAFLDLLLPVLMGFGIINNPTDQEKI